MARPIAGMSVLVTGGGSGIGETVVTRLAAAGAHVTLTGRRAEKIGAVAERTGARPVTGDVTVEADRHAMVDAAVEHGGGLDAVVHAAGNMYRGPLAELTEQGLHDVFASNTIAPMLLTGLALPHLVASGGAVVFFGSVHTQRAFPGASPYAATKGALETLTGVLAAELGPQGVRVSCVRPGGVLTEINQRAGVFDDATAAERMQSLGPAHALGRPGTTDEVAEAVEYLLGAEWVTGNVLTVDGGLGLGVTHA
ncbi:NAD(P)-dependent dehydrogenase (short-subunit alcohol dehydrogenase family) [Actinomycetospora succinea]|uniref:NAD(P)-dependent dehydrogenase (Short-subunit alcohol dehydrogenase family) n=1 Tax=Actinomycetospora succinea TaxID=663603 RepID=A0A4R6UX60_9PSEU|nr:SDR family oxidoreductase [Actinomycetospora succinea]TDQ51801.1 NAD(P)-dependent dehydrogenase (short-subunit alcohol dehydrogenase family) [Actinomycetospora succinea]